ncbi:hypothetical protein C479_11200 [Halovivax asiaticus JCM 14624]|uniref:Uncharacterized protein n=1 Tax=Halovivax asiaticus JCM 14624 TaxID=1227490 RepID=M0BIA7_9EURY|nr:hypothetical protein [Halovivax asiaticus]ELZ09384.1 hypothetical protein C479_11200 [Halovivax asiaticus JCM 14624]
MRRLFDSDLAFYAAVGVFITALFLVGLAILAALNPDGIGTRELGGFVVGFGLFMVSYVTAMVIYRLVPDDIDAS